MPTQLRKISTGLLLTTVCATALAATPAATPTPTPTALVDTWSVGITAGTLGLGPEVAYRYGHFIGLRASAGFLSYNHNETVNDITYNGRLKLDSYGLAADLFPFGGGFRISAGARKNNNRIDLNGTPSTPVTIGNTVYTPAQIGTLYGTVEGNSFAPTVSLGYGGRLAKGLTLGAEIGVMFQGTPKVDNYHATGQLASNPAFQADLAEERQKVDDKVHNYQYWPIAQLILLYRF